MLKRINMIRNAETPLGVILLAFFMTLSSPVAAQDYQKGLATYYAGDYATALQEWTPLAEAGDASAQYNLGLMYDNGQGVPEDYAEAVRWYRLAVEQSVADAVKWYRLTADQNDTHAQINLGAMYDNGQGVPQDDAEAVKLYRLSAEQSVADTQNNLGIMYEYGKGVLQDNVMAHMWYNTASVNGHDKAGEWRDERAGLMTPADIFKAQGMARECMSSGYTKCGY